MTKELVEQKERERRSKHGELRKKIFDKIIESGFTEEEAVRIKKDLRNDMNSPFLTVAYYGEEFAQMVEDSMDKAGNVARLIECFDKFRTLTKEYFNQLREAKYSFVRFQDSDPMEFDGDIIITDPCYILNPAPNRYDDDWEKCYWGENLEELGIIHSISRDTIFGDWSCSVYNLNTKRKIGEFCADSGMVAVMDLKEVLDYNPSFDYHEQRKWTTTLIPNFKGTVQFVVKEEPYEYDGKNLVDYEVKVVGRGINKRSKKPFEFIGTQTGF